MVPDIPWSLFGRRFVFVRISWLSVGAIASRLALIFDAHKPKRDVPRVFFPLYLFSLSVIDTYL
jgi:hypothetical protein